MAPPAKTPKVGYEPGDTVYARADSGPMVLKVLASGADGFTGEAEDGQRHKVLHDRYLGHQRRMKHSYTVADEGEDGCLLEDESGARRFISGKPPNAPDDKPNRDNAHRFAQVHTEDLKLDGLGSLSKALMLAPLPPLPGGLALLMKSAVAQSAQPQKAKSSAPKPKKPDAKDKRAGPALHKHGDYVAFRHEDVLGTGRIVGSGMDGITVVDEETGREHLVRHDAILPEHPPEPEATDNALPGSNADAKLDGGKKPAPKRKSPS